MYIFIYLCMYIHTYMHTYIQTYKHTYLQISVRTYININRTHVFSVIMLASCNVCSSVSSFSSRKRKYSQAFVYTICDYVSVIFCGHMGGADACLCIWDWIQSLSMSRLSLFACVRVCVYWNECACVFTCLYTSWCPQRQAASSTINLFICTCERMYVHLHVCTHVSIHVYIVCTYLCMYVCVYICMYVYICIYVCIYKCLPLSVFILSRFFIVTLK